MKSKRSLSYLLHPSETSATGLSWIKLRNLQFISIVSITICSMLLINFKLNGFLNRKNFRPRLFVQMKLSSAFFFLDALKSLQLTYFLFQYEYCSLVVCQLFANCQFSTGIHNEYSHISLICSTKKHQISLVLTSRDTINNSNQSLK